MYQKYNHHYYSKETPLYTCCINGGLYRWDSICLDLSPLKAYAQTRTHALTSKHEACTIMLLSNLAEPEWISIPCNKKLLYFVFCVKKNKLNYLHWQNVTNNISVKSCEHFQITVKKDCYSFVWLRNEHRKQKLSGHFVDRFHFETLHHLFNAIRPSKSVPNIHLKGNNITNYVVKVTWQSHKINFKYRNIMKTEAEGIHLLKLKRHKKGFEMLIFFCKKGGYIIYTYVCDGKKDCPNNDDTDESYSNCKYEIELPDNSKIEYLLTQNISNKCPPLYQMSKDKYCKQFITKLPLYHKSTYGYAEQITVVKLNP